MENGWSRALLCPIHLDSGWFTIFTDIHCNYKKLLSFKAMANYQRLILNGERKTPQSVTCWMRLPLVSTFLGRWFKGFPRPRKYISPPFFVAFFIIFCGKIMESNINTWKMAQNGSKSRKSLGHHWYTLISRNISCNMWSSSATSRNGTPLFCGAPLNTS